MSPGNPSNKFQAMLIQAKGILKFSMFMFSLLVLAGGCKSPAERHREAAGLDSLRRDSARPVNNPYKFGQGTEMYNNERENLGKLDSLVTPEQPAIPRH